MIRFNLGYLHFCSIDHRWGVKEDVLGDAVIYGK